MLAEAWHALRRRWLLYARYIWNGASAVSQLVSVWWRLVRYSASVHGHGRFADLRGPVEHPESEGTSGRLIGICRIFKRTQRQYVRGPRILASVLQREAVASKIDPGENDPLSWLQQIVNVSYPDEAEIMLVSVRSDDRRNGSRDDLLAAARRRLPTAGVNDCGTSDPNESHE